LDDLYHQANANVARITGTTTTSMIAVELMRSNRSAAAIGPFGSKTPDDWQEAVSNAVHPTGQRYTLFRRGPRCRLLFLLIEWRSIRWIDDRIRNTPLPPMVGAGEVNDLIDPATDHGLHDVASRARRSGQLQAPPAHDASIRTGPLKVKSGRHMLYLAAPRCDCPERSEGQYAGAWQSSHPQEP